MSLFAVQPFNIILSPANIWLRRTPQSAAMLAQFWMEIGTSRRQSQLQKFQVRLDTVQDTSWGMDSIWNATMDIIDMQNRVRMEAAVLWAPSLPCST